MFANKLQTICQKPAFFVNFLPLQILAKPYKISYLPQHCLYFLPLPHGGAVRYT